MADSQTLNDAAVQKLEDEVESLQLLISTSSEKRSYAIITRFAIIL